MFLNTNPPKIRSSMEPDVLKAKLEEFQSECETMQEFLESRASDTPELMLERLTQINSYLARSGMLLADAKLIQDNERAALYLNNVDVIKKMPVSTAKAFIESQTGEINYYVNWLDRINRSLVHVGDNLRTQVSYAKEELRLTKNGY